MSKIAVNIPDKEKSIVDKFVEKITGYKNRSDLVRKALRNEMERDYNTLEELAGSWSEKKAEKAKKAIRKSENEDINAQENDTRH